MTTVEEAKEALRETCAELVSQAASGKLVALAYVSIKVDGSVSVDHVGVDDEPLVTIGALEVLREHVRASVRVSHTFGHVTRSDAPRKEAKG